MFGIIFKDHPKLERLLLPADFTLLPHAEGLRDREASEMAEMWLNMGPQHPMTHGLWNLRVKIDGETITEAEPVIGYLHRGLGEDGGEPRPMPQIIPMADRLCYGASFTWSHCILPDRRGPHGRRGARACASTSEPCPIELAEDRLHLMWLAAIGPDLGSTPIFLYAMRERELFLDLFQSLSGARMTYNYPRIGGVRNDVPPNFERDLVRMLDHFEKRLNEYEALFDRNAVFRMRMEDVGKLSAKEAMNLGVTGPNLRGSGVDYDLRRDDPYEVYDEVDFNVCVQEEGDAYARYRVRMDEMSDVRQDHPPDIKKMPKSGQSGSSRPATPR